ncbi:MAG: DUF2092 domain-containing protein [Reyranellales bacterium]
MKLSTRACLTVTALLLLTVLPAAQAQQPPAAPGPTATPAPGLGPRVEIEPAALALIKAMSDRLAAARTMSFTAITTYESPARTGEPLAYTTLSEVTLQRPDKLRVLTPGDGPASEFHYDGKTAMAYEPEARLVAVAEAPDTIDKMLVAAYERAAIYFPFTDVIVSDPRKDLEDGLRMAFVIGKSRVVGGVPTDIVALVGKTVHAQIWIGSDDKLPRMMRATFTDEPGHYRHVVEFSNWKLDVAVPPGTFSSTAPANATRVEFARPDAAGVKTGK